MTEVLFTILIWIGLPILVYVTVRLATSAYFRSKHDYEESRDGFRKKENK